MSKRISLKLTDKNDWLVEAIENFNNTIETILVSYFKGKEEKNKNVPTYTKTK